MYDCTVICTICTVNCCKMKMQGLLTTPYSMSPFGTPVTKSATGKAKDKRSQGAISKQT